MTDTDNDVQLRIKLARATHSMGAVAKKGTGHHGKYATLNDVLETVQTALDAEQLVVSQPIVTNDGVCVISTMITDLTTGAVASFSGPGFPLKNDPQVAGSAITYYRRYGLVSLFGIKADDDDGAMAHRSASNPQGRTPAEKEIRELVKAMSKTDRTAFQSDFQEQFGSTLTNLPESRHGDALTWAKQWSTGPDTATPDDAYEGAT